MQHTSNYNLPQWEATDPIKRADFNGAMSAIDTAVKAASDAAGAGVKLVTGSYTGTGTYGSANKNTLTFSGTPYVLFVSGSWWQFTAIRGATYASDIAPSNNVQDVHTEWGAKTVSWYSGSNATLQLNESGKTYYYVALLAS